jgi:hypothetical protein
MKTIFRSLNLAVLLAALTVAGAIAAFAQDPCSDTAGQDALSNKVRELFPKTDLPSQSAKIEAGKQFIEKYGACDSAKEFAEYLKTNVPKWEAKLKTDTAKAAQDPLIKKFNAGLTSKNWDDVYAAGKELIAQWPDDFRAAELVLGSIGLDETAKTPRVTKWNDDTLTYARMSIADLESGKTFKTFGVNPFTYKNKDDALGWMNYTVGYIMAVDKNDKKNAVNYLYKATQLNSDTASNPVVYETIGLYYFDEVNKLADDVKAKIATQSDTDTEDVKKQKIEAIKAAVAQVNGASERALDVFARAYKFAPKDEKNKAYRDRLYKNLQDVYKVRFGKPDGLDAWIANATSKPFPNPSSPITPVYDPEPTAPATTTSGSAATPTPAGTKPAASPATTKPDAKAPAKPVEKPAANVKPQASVKRTVARKKRA